MSTEPIVKWTGDQPSVLRDLFDAVAYLGFAMTETDLDGWPPSVIAAAGRTFQLLSAAGHHAVRQGAEDEIEVVPFEDVDGLNSALQLMRPIVEHLMRGRDSGYGWDKSEFRGLGLMLEAAALITAHHAKVDFPETTGGARDDLE